ISGERRRVVGDWLAGPAELDGEVDWLRNAGDASSAQCERRVDYESRNRFPERRFRKKGRKFQPRFSFSVPTDGEDSSRNFVRNGTGLRRSVGEWKTGDAGGAASTVAADAVEDLLCQGNYEGSEGRREPAGSGSSPPPVRAERERQRSANADEHDP